MPPASQINRLSRPHLEHTRYDVFDRRIGKASTPAVGPAYTERYVYNGDHLALKFDGGQLANRYLHGPVIDQILADEQVDALTSPGEVLWPLADNLGTVRDLAEHDSATGTTTIVNHISYDAFGGITAESSAAVDHLFGYTGREWDAEADLQYNRARWYDPAVGRWMSQDPIGFAAGDANLHRYVENRPLQFIDPTGLAPNQEGVTDPQHVLDLIEQLEGEGMSSDDILGEISDRHTSNDDRYFYTEEHGWVDIRHFGAAAEIAHGLARIIHQPPRASVRFV